MILATLDLVVFASGATDLLDSDIAIGAMVGGFILAIYFWLLTFTKQKDLPL